MGALKCEASFRCRMFRLRRADIDHRPEWVKRTSSPALDAVSAAGGENPPGTKLC